MNHDEMPSGGLPWLTSPVMLHSSREYKCKLPTQSMCKYQQGFWRFWYGADWAYALSTVYFCCATIGVFAIAHWFSRFAPVGVKRSGPWKKAQALSRYLSYRGFRINALHWTSPALGTILIGLVGTIFFAALTLGPKPYYWDNTKDGQISWGSSPPIATRAGWMAVALLPFVIVLSAKANMISAVTGISYERIQVYHHWTSYAMFVLALVHTFPFIIYHIWMGDMEKKWKTDMVYWTGVAALIPQTWLTILSIGPIRNRYYEIFKSTHFVAAIFFVLFFFWHCDFRLSSWDYFIATFILYFLSWGFATFRTYALHGVRPAMIEMLPCGFIKIVVDAGITKWKPGQHVFLRFLIPDIHALTSHPFTICSLTEQNKSEMIFYVKPHRGFTARLAKIAEHKSGGAMRVLVEGPYGGLGYPETVAGYDETIVIAGGSGAGFTFPIIEDILRRRAVRSGDKSKLHIILATPSNVVAEWYRATLNSLFIRYSVEANESHGVDVAIHHSGLASGSDIELPRPGEKGDPIEEVAVEPASLSSEATFHTGRPDLPKFIRERTSGRRDTRVAVTVCGPSSMLHDVRNAVAEAQGRVNKEVGEVWLHAEHFGW